MVDGQFDQEEGQEKAKEDLAEISECDRQHGIF